MKLFTLICALLVIAIGAAEFYGWGGDGGGPQTLVSAIPVFFGAALLLGTILSLFLRRTGLQIAFLFALAGGFAALGRLAPSYLKETLDWKSYPSNLMVAMSGVCFVYVLVAAFLYLFVRRKGSVKKGLAEGDESAQEECVGKTEEQHEQQEQEKEVGEEVGETRDGSEEEKEKESESPSTHVS